MRFNIPRPPPDVIRRDKISARQKWHTKFAWLPTIVDEKNDGYNKVWFEKYWRRGSWGPSRLGESNPLRYTKYSEKEYFKKKLSGYFDQEDTTEDDGDTNRRTTAPVAGHVSSNKMLKKGGPYSTTNFKRMVITKEEDESLTPNTVQMTIDPKTQKTADEIINQIRKKRSKK